MPSRHPKSTAPVALIKLFFADHRYSGHACRAQAVSRRDDRTARMTPRPPRPRWPETRQIASIHRPIPLPA
jgi:hypothetical protein